MLHGVSPSSLGLTFPVDLQALSTPLSQSPLQQVNLLCKADCFGCRTLCLLRVQRNMTLHPLVYIDLSVWSILIETFPFDCLLFQFAFQDLCNLHSTSETLSEKLQAKGYYHQRIRDSNMILICPFVTLRSHFQPPAFLGSVYYISKLPFWATSTLHFSPYFLDRYKSFP